MGWGIENKTLVDARHTLQGRRVAADDMAAALGYMVEEPPAPQLSIPSACGFPTGTSDRGAKRANIGFR